MTVEKRVRAMIKQTLGMAAPKIVAGAQVVLAVMLLATVAAAQSFTIVPNRDPIPRGVEDEPYPGLGFIVSNVPTPPARNFRVVPSNGLPDGLVINNVNGNITGTPTNSGNFTFRVRVDDSGFIFPFRQTVTSSEITIRVADDDDDDDDEEDEDFPPLVFGTAAGLPAGIVGTAYSTGITATGGDGTFVWTVKAGSTLPPGINLVLPANTATATLSGTPTIPGNYTFTLVVNDGNATTAAAEREFSLPVSALPPLVTQLTPNSAVVGASDTVITVTGSNFVSGAVVVFGTTNLVTEFGNASSLTATIPTASLTTPGPVNVFVRNPNNQVSGTVPFTISPPAAPSITQLSPNSAIAGANDTVIAVTGSNFVSNAVIVFGTTNLVTEFGDASSLTATIPASLLSAAGSANVTVKNPDGQISNTRAFTIELLPPPSVSAVTPSEIVASGEAVPVAVSGSLFREGAVVTFGGIDLVTTFGSASTVTATIPETLIFGGTKQIAVRNPQPGGQTSNNVSLTVQPVLSALSDGDNNDNSPVGGPAFNLSISGFGFSVTDGQNLVQFAGQSVPVVSQGARLIVVSIPASAIAAPGLKPVIVSTNGVNSAAREYFVIGDTTITITNDSNLGTRTSGTAFSVDLDATGGNGNQTWSVATGSTLPPGLNLNAGTGVLSGTLGQAGSYSFAVRVVDDANPGQSSGQKTFTLVVQDFVVSTTSLPQARVGISYSVQLAVGGGPTVPSTDYHWTLVSGVNSLPAGISFNQTGGTLSGVPDAIGAPSQNFTVRVSARHTPTGLVTPVRTLPLTVSGGGLDISVTSLPLGIVNQAYGLFGGGATITPVNGTAPYTIAVNTAQSAQLSAAGFTVATTLNNNPASPPSTLRITGTPTTTGSFPVEITVRDAGNTQVTRTLTLLVTANILTIQPETLPAATVDSDYTQQLSVSGMSAEEENPLPGQRAVTWSLLGSVPGLTLNSTTGVLSGRFTTLGQRQFTIQAATRLRETSLRYTLDVGGPKPAISTSTLPPATVGQEYGANVTVAGGTDPYTWPVAGVILPAGLSFDAGTVNTANLRIAGTPTAGAQTRTFTLTVRDSTGQTATREFTITVTATPIPAISLQPFSNPVPAEQKDVVVTLAQPYPIPLQGTATVTFTPNATNNADDPAIRFLSGERTANFTIPANTTQAVFDEVPVQRVQTGTVAGTIRVEAQISGGPADAEEFILNRSAPFLQDSLTLQSSANGFTVVVTGYSTPRDLSSAQLTFAPTSGTNLQTTQLTIPLTEAATQWFQSSTGRGSGSTFRLTIPLTVQNSANALASVTVTLSNSVGASNTRTRAF